MAFPHELVQQGVDCFCNGQRTRDWNRGGGVSTEGRDRLAHNLASSSRVADHSQAELRARGYSHRADDLKFYFQQMNETSTQIF